MAPAVVVMALLSPVVATETAGVVVRGGVWTTSALIEQAGTAPVDGTIVHHGLTGRPGVDRVLPVSRLVGGRGQVVVWVVLGVEDT